MSNNKGQKKKKTQEKGGAQVQKPLAHRESKLKQEKARFEAQKCTTSKQWQDFAMNPR